jgi:hypothetical protein
MSRRPPEYPRPKTVPSRGVAKRLEIEVLPTDVAVIRQVAALTGQTTLAAVLRDALKAYVWMVREQPATGASFPKTASGGTAWS